jgi:hypothetical protein
VIPHSFFAWEDECVDQPEPRSSGRGRLGDIPASGFYGRNANNIEFSNIEIDWSQPDVRPVFSLNNVTGAEFFRIKTPKGLSTPVFAFNKSEDINVISCRSVKDIQLDLADHKTI